MQINYVKDTNKKYVSQGGIYLIREIFQQNQIDKFIDGCFPSRSKQSQYSDSDLALGLCYSLFAGGTFFEDVNRLRDEVNVPGYIELPSSDSIKYRMKQLTECTREIISKGQVSHDFNINIKLNRVLTKLAVKLNPDFRKRGVMLDYDNTVISTLKGDSKFSYKHCYGYQPGVLFIGREPVYIEGRNGNSTSSYLMDQTLERGMNLLREEGVKIGAIRIDGAAYQRNVFDLMGKYQGLRYYIRGKSASSIWDAIRGRKCGRKTKIAEEEVEYIQGDWYTPGGIDEERKCRVVVYRYEEHDQQLDLFDGKYIYYVIYTNDRTLSGKKIINLYNQRGRAEQNFDRLKNDFNWAHPPFDNLAMNTAYLIFTAMGCQLYNFLLKIISKVFHGLRPETRIKRFIFLFVNVVAKWTHRGRRYILNLYTDRAYDKLLAGP
jgi:hypothetical protein